MPWEPVVVVVGLALVAIAVIDWIWLEARPPRPGRRADESDEAYQRRLDEWQQEHSAGRRPVLLSIAAVILLVGLVAAPLLAYAADDSCKTTTEEAQGTQVEEETKPDDAGVDQTTRTETSTPATVTTTCEERTIGITSPIVLGSVALALVVLSPLVSEFEVPGLLSLKWKAEAQLRESEATRKETEALQAQVRTELSSLQIANQETNVSNQLSVLIEGGDVSQTTAAEQASIELLEFQRVGIESLLAAQLGVSDAWVSIFFYRARGARLTTAQTSSRAAGTEPVEVGLDSDPIGRAWSEGEPRSRQAPSGETVVAAPIFDIHDRKLGVLTLTATLAEDQVRAAEQALATVTDPLALVLTRILRVQARS